MRQAYVENKAEDEKYHYSPKLQMLDDQSQAVPAEHHLEWHDMQLTPILGKSKGARLLADKLTMLVDTMLCVAVALWAF